MSIIKVVTNPIIGSRCRTQSLLMYTDSFNYIVKRFKGNDHNQSKSTNNLIKSQNNQEHKTNVTTVSEKIKQTTKTTSYLGIILIGVAVTGSLFYAIFNELFSGKSPNNVYSKALKICLSDNRVLDKLGEPVKAFGEENRRGRRQHVSHVLFKRGDRNCLRMKFYLQGNFQKGIVQLEMIENDTGDYEYRYLLVEIDDFSRTTIILKDNRNKFLVAQPFSGFT